MGLYSGAVSFWRYRILGEMTKSSHLLDDLSREIKKKELRGFSLPPGHWERRTGWVCPPLGEDLDGNGLIWENWDLSSCYMKNAQGYVLRMRIEERKVSKELTQLLWQEKRKEIKNSLSKKEMKELKEEFKEDLLKKTLPKVSYVDIFWQDDFKEILCFTTGKKKRELFEALFSDTFGMIVGGPLVSLSVGLLGSENSERQSWSSEEHLLEALKPLTEVTPLTTIL